MENKDYKVYSLKKEYPGSPKKGTIVIESYEDYYSPISSFRFSDKKLIEDFPDNWELQTTPDFIVKSLISPTGYLRTGKEVMYEHAYGMYPDYKIHTIRRTSDGEEFSLGDNIQGLLGNIGKINKITYSERECLKKGFWLHYESGNSHISMVKKLRQPLFKTEDGVDIFEGDKYTFIWINKPAKNQNILTPYTKKATKLNEEESWSESAKFFSTTEKAEEYIKMNKPEFSRNQILNLLDGFHFGGQMKYHFMNLLTKEIVKQ